MAEKEIIMKLGTDADLTILEKYRDLMNDVLHTYEENIEQLVKLKQENKDYETALKKIEDDIKKGNITREQANALIVDNAGNISKNKTAISQLNQTIKEQEKFMRAENEEYKRTNSLVGLLSQTFRKMSKEQRDANQDLEKDIDKLRNMLKAADASIGNFQRNVGNYGSVWNGLHAQMQMVVRELPSLTMSANQFFLAISNNLPMLADEIKRTVETNKQLKAEGKATKPVLTQLVQSLVSWQTALVVGITLLSRYGNEIAEWTKELIKGENTLESLNISIKQTTSSLLLERIQLNAMFSALRQAKEGTAEYATIKQNILNKYGSFLKNQSKEIKNLKDIDGAYKALMQTMSAKAIMDASMKQISEAAEKYGKKIKNAIDDIRDTFDNFLPSKGYTKEQINELFNEYIAGIVSNEPELKARAEEIRALFDYIRGTEGGGFESANRLDNYGIFSTSGTTALINALNKYNEKINAVTEASGIMAKAFGITAKAIDDVSDETSDATDSANKYDMVAQQLIDWIDKQGAAGDATAVKLTNLRIEYERLRKAALSVGLSVTDLDKAYNERFTEILTEAANKSMNLGIIKISPKIDTKSIKAEAAREMAEMQIELDAAFESGELAPVATSAFARWLGVSDEEFEQIKSQALQFAQQLYSELEQLAKDSIQRRLDDELDALDRETESKKAALKKQADDGVISQKTYERRLSEIDKEAAAKQEELKKEAFEKEKKLNMIEAAINGAQAVLKTFAKYGWTPVGQAMATIAAVQAAAQIAIISSQKYARGGLLQGASHAQGGIKGSVHGNNIELEGGEVVINKRSSAMFRRELSDINSYNGWGQKFAAGGELPKRFKFAEGGQLPSFAPAPLPAGADTGIAQVANAMNKRYNQLERAIDATNRRIDRIRAVVVYDDIESTGNDIRVAVERTSL